MPTISDILRDLSFGPLSNLAMSDEGSGKILSGSQPKVIQHLNSALTRVYTRFNLLEKEIILRILDGRTTYYFKAKYADSNLGKPNTGPYYLVDGSDPFIEDFIKPLQVITTSGCELPINDAAKHNSVFTPFPETVQIQFRPPSGYLSVIYQARHKKLDLNNLEQEVNIPDSLYQAVLNFVASAVYSDMNGQENLLKSKDLQMKYEEICEEIKEFDSMNSSISTSEENFERKGWI